MSPSWSYTVIVVATRRSHYNIHTSYLFERAVRRVSASTFCSARDTGDTGRSEEPSGEPGEGKRPRNSMSACRICALWQSREQTTSLKRVTSTHTRVKCRHTVENRAPGPMCNDALRLEGTFVLFCGGCGGAAGLWPSPAAAARARVLQGHHAHGSSTWPPARHVEAYVELDHAPPLPSSFPLRTCLVVRLCGVEEFSTGEVEHKALLSPRHDHGHGPRGRACIICRLRRLQSEEALQHPPCAKELSKTQHRINIARHITTKALGETHLYITLCRPCDGPL